MEQKLQMPEGLDESLFVNRDEDLAYFWKWATNAPYLKGNAIALIGRRRTGKTALLLRLFNRLFLEQTEIVPVYITFARYLNSAKVITSYEFAEEYFRGYVSSYLAFRYRNLDLFLYDFHLEEVRQYAEEKQDSFVLNLFRRYEIGVNARIPYGLVNFAINLPNSMAWKHDMPTAVIVDEFQVLTDVHDPVQDVHHDITDSFQHAVEGRWAPMIVSGSSVSLLVNQALGGMLSGRFQYWDIRPLPQEDAHDLVFRLSKYQQYEEQGVYIDEQFAEAVHQMTGGYPYSIDCIMSSRSQNCIDFPDLGALEQVVIYELTELRGQLYQHYNEEFGKFIHELNEGDTTRLVMLWVTKHADELLMAKNIAKSLNLDRKEVARSLERLRQVDVIKRQGLLSYYGPSDPMLCRYIEYQHSLEFDDLTPETVVKNWKEEYDQIRGNLNRALGEIGELYARMVMRGFDEQAVNGTDYFSLSGEVTLPKFTRIERRGGLVVEGEPAEIDVIGEWLLQNEPDNVTKGAWLVEAKYTQKPITKPTVEHFLKQSKHVEERFGYQQTVRWFFSRNGFTEPATDLMIEEGVLYSNWHQFLALARTMGFFGLPSRK